MAQAPHAPSWPFVCHPHRCQTSRRPAIWGRFRRFTHQQQAAHLQKPGRALDRHRWRAESSRDDQIEPVAQVGIAGGILRPSPPHFDAALEPEFTDCLFQKCRPALVRVQKYPSARGPGGGEDQSWKPATTPEIQRAVRWVDDEKPLAMPDLVVDGTRPDEPEALRPLQRPGEQLDQALSAAAAGLITTRRRGSSPSDVVTTPSMSLTVS